MCIIVVIHIWYMRVIMMVMVMMVMVRMVKMQICMRMFVIRMQLNRPRPCDTMMLWDVVVWDGDVAETKVFQQVFKSFKSQSAVLPILAKYWQQSSLRRWRCIVHMTSFTVQWFKRAAIACCTMQVCLRSTKHVAVAQRNPQPGYAARKMTSHLDKCEFPP